MKADYPRHPIHPRTPPIYPCILLSRRSQCCYDEEGDLIVDIAAGGGTIDRVESEWWAASIAHYKQDVEPYNWCCAEGHDSWQCGLCEYSPFLLDSLTPPRMKSHLALHGVRHRLLYGSAEDLCSTQMK